MQAIPSDEQRTRRPKGFVTLCGRIFHDADPQYFPSTQYHGRTLRLCTDACLGAFLADPEVFYKVHRNSEKDKNTGNRV